MLEVAVGIVRNVHQEVFITQRRPGTFMAGKWEFPGGKVEVDETPEQALARELLEEIGIVIKQSVLFQELTYAYAEKRVKLYFYLVEQWQGEPYQQEGQNAVWIPCHKLQEEHFLPANTGIIFLLKNPHKITTGKQIRQG